MTVLTVEYIETTYPEVGGCKLTSDLSHWEGYGITTVEGLNFYLDECDRRERRKQAMYEEW